MKVLDLFLMGYEDLIPLEGKAPYMAEWQKHKATMKDCEEWEGKNIGLLTRNFPAIDCDVTDREMSIRILSLARGMFGKGRPLRVGLVPKWLLPFRAGEHMTKRVMKFRRQGVEHGIELLADGQQHVVQGIHPDTGNPYQWVTPLVPAEQLLTLNKEMVEEFFGKVAKLVCEEFGCVIGSDTSSADRVAVDTAQLYAPSMEHLSAAVKKIYNGEDIPRDTFIKVGHAIRGSTRPEDDVEGLDIFIEYASRGVTADPDEPTRVWNTIRRDNITTGWDRIKQFAVACGWDGAPAAVEQAQQEFKPVIEEGEEPHAVEFPLTLDDVADYPLGQYILDRTTELLNAGQKDWFVWDGCRWEDDSAGRAFTYVSDQLSTIQKHLKEKYPSPGVTGRTAMLSLASSNRTLTVMKQLAPHLYKSRDTFNDPTVHCYTLCTPGGVFDLRNELSSTHSPDDYITQMTKVDPNDQEDCPEFKKFLATSCAGDDQLLRYVQSVIGSSLTADVSDRLIWFLTGESGSGKSTLLKHVHEILGDYAGIIPPGALIHGDTQAHSSAVAGFRDRRFLHGSEIDRGHKWNVSLLKSITGNEVITARRLYHEYEEFEVVGKIIIAGNETPTLPNVDSAMKRRLRIIPFSAPDEPDEDLDAKLAAEHPAILAWMMEGARKWAADGYPHCEVVFQTTNEYFVDEDTVAQFRDATFMPTRSDEDFINTKDVFTLWEQYTTPHQRRDLGIVSASTLGKALRASDNRIGKAKRRDGEHVNPLNGMTGLKVRNEAGALADLL